MSQSHPRQQGNSNDMQLLQQHLMYKRLQELQRQQQLQQLNRISRQQNSFSQQPAAVRQAANDQSPALLNGMPIGNASSYLWQNEFSVGESKIPSSSQITVADSISWRERNASPGMQGFPNGLIFSNDTGQAKRSLGFSQQELDQSLYGRPVSTPRGSSHQYAQLHGVLDRAPEEMAKAGGKPGEKTSFPLAIYNTSDNSLFPEHVQYDLLAAKQGFQRNILSRNFPSESLISGVSPGNFTQMTPESQSVQIQEHQDRKDQENWSRSLQMAEAQAGASPGVSTLDPTEERLLYGMDYEGKWDASFARNGSISSGGYINAHPLENNDCFGAFPTLQSGSWSALMQDALEASSSDTGLQEEWSGVSFHKTELTAGNQSTILDDSVKQKMTWENNNLQSASSLTSRPFPLFNDAEANQDCRTGSTLQHSSIELTCGQRDRALADASIQSFQQSSKEATFKQSDQNHMQEQFAEGTLQAQMHLDNASNDVWTRQMHGQSVNITHSADVEFNAHGMEVSSSHNWNMPSPNIGRQPATNYHEWNANDSSGPTSNISSLFPFRDGSESHSQKGSVGRTPNLKKVHSNNMWNISGNQVNSTGGVESMDSDVKSPKVQAEKSCINNFMSLDTNSLEVMQEMNQINGHQVNFEDHSVVGKYVHHQAAGGPRPWQSSDNNLDKQLCGTYNNQQEDVHSKVVFSEGYVSNLSRSGQIAHGGVVARGSSLLSGHNPPHFSSAVQKLPDQSGQKLVGSYRFQHHPSGNLDTNMESTHHQEQTSYSQDLCQLQGLKNRDQRYTGHSQFVGHAVSSNATSMGKGQLTTLQRNTKGPDERQARHPNISGNSGKSATNDGSALQFSKDTRIGQTSQDMLELFHKVNQSMDSNTLKQFNLPNHGIALAMDKSAASDGSASCPPHYQSTALRGLELAPPSQRHPALNRALPSPTPAHDFSPRLLEPEAGERDQRWSVSSTSVRSPIPSHETSQKENSDNISSMSGQTPKESSHDDSSAVSASTLPYFANQLRDQQRQRISKAASNHAMDKSVNSSFGSQADEDAQNHASRLRLTHDSSNGGVGSDQPVHSDVTFRTPPFRLGSAAGFHLSPSSLSPLLSKVYSQPMSHSNAGQQVPEPETKSALRPSATSAMPEQVGCSTRSHNVWTDVPAQRLPSVLPQKFTPNILQSMIQSTGSRDTSSWALQKANVQSTKRGSAEPEFGTCAINSQQFMSGEENPAKETLLEREEVVPGSRSTYHMQESMSKPLRDRISSTPFPSLVHQQREDSGRGNFTQGSFVGSQTHNLLQKDTPNSSDAQHKNYSLLQQMQAMKGADADPVIRVGKRLKGADFISEASQMDWRSPQMFTHGQNTAFKIPVDQLGLTSHLPSDVKMLSFAAKNRGDNNENTSSQLIPGEVSSRILNTAVMHDLNNRSSSGGSERSYIGPQRASTWLEQYGNYKNGQALGVFDGQRSAKSASHQQLFANISEKIDDNNSVEHRHDTSQVSTPGQSASSTLLAANELPSPFLPSDFMDKNIVLATKKRKSSASNFLPWYDEVAQVPRRLQSTSTAELAWAQTTNRLIEKVDDEFEIVEDGSSMPRPHRRLILTTQLMQQLIPSVPAAILAAEAYLSFESVTYFAAKTVLGDACSSISCSRNGSRAHGKGKNLLVKNDREPLFLKVIESFIGRSRKLESDFSRLARTSMLDARMECQELERFSIINRLGKFHGRSQADGSGSSSTSGHAPHKALPQRYVTAFPISGNLPEGVLCLSL